MEIFKSSRVFVIKYNYNNILLFEWCFKGNKLNFDYVYWFGYNEICFMINDLLYFNVVEFL